MKLCNPFPQPLETLKGKPMKTTLTICAALLSITCLAPAAYAGVHAEKCDPIPKEEWKSQAELEKKLTNQGWKVNRVKIENGCYEVYGKDEKGAKVEVFFHPKTLDVVTAPK
jgi:hypothetical protein